MGSVDGKREAKRETTVLVSPKSSACSATVSTLSPVSPATSSNSSVLATAPIDVLGVAVKRSSDKETEGWPLKPSPMSSSESPVVGGEFTENGLSVEVDVEVVEIVVVEGDVEKDVVLAGLLELVVAVLVTDFLVVTGSVLLEADVGAEVTRLKSIPKSEGNELLVSSGSTTGLLVVVLPPSGVVVLPPSGVVVLPPSGATMSGLIGMSRGIVIRAILGAVTVGKVTLGKVTLPSWPVTVVPPTSSKSPSDPLVSPETLDRSKKFEDFGCSLKKLGSVTRVLVGSVPDASDNWESMETGD